MDMDKRRVCCFCEKWESGGIESFMHNVIWEMDLSRLEIDIVAAQICESVFTAGLKEKGVHFYELSGNQRKLGKNHKMFKQLLKERQYDVVHLNIFQGLSLYYAYLAKKAGVRKIIAHSHNSALRQSKTKWLKMLLHNVGKNLWTENATDYWACSKPAAEFMFTPKSLCKYEFIPNGIDVERFRFNEDFRKQIRRDLNIEDKLVIGNVGRLCYQKNQEYLLEVFAKLQSQRPDSVLLLVGDGELKAELQQQVEKLGVSNKVIFYGVTDKVEQLLWAMDIFVMPSQFEGLPVTAVEAQAAGLPCILSDRITPECGLTEKTVFLSLDAKKELWLKAICELSVGNLQRETAADEVKNAGFAVEDVAKRIEKAYLGLRN